MDTAESCQESCEVHMAKNNAALFFVNSFTGGGAERVCYDLICASSKQQETKVVVLDGRDDYGLLPKRCQVLNLDIDPIRSNAHRFMQIIASIGKVNRFIGNPESYDVISAHLNMSQLLARLSCVASRTLYVMHGAQQATDSHRSIRRRFSLKARFGQSQLVCVSRGIERELIDDYGFSRNQCCTIYNPLDLKKIKALLTEENERKPSRPYFLAAGRLEEIKRYDRLVDIFSQGKFFQEYDLVILGSGTQLEALQNQASSLGLDNRVHFPGFVANPYVWMRDSSIFLCCSDSEAFPVGLLEALYCGARVVSGRCSYGPDEILTGPLEKYLVSPIDDVTAYIPAIQNALCSYLSIEENSFSRFEPESILAAYKNRWKEVFGS